MKLFLIGIIFCSSFLLTAQQIENPFSLIKGEREFIYGLDNRRTHIHGDRAVIYGLYSGIGFSEKKLRFKIGLNASPFLVGKDIDEMGLIKQSRFFFLNLGEELDFLIVNNFRMSTYVQLGFGFDYCARFDAVSQLNYDFTRRQIIPLELGMHVGYSVLDWLAIKAGGGWRLVFPTPSSDLSGYYLKLGLQLNTTEMCIAYRKWTTKRSLAKSN